MTIAEYNFCGFKKIVACAPVVKPADIDFNLQGIINYIDENREADLILFPELSITGYTCADLFNQNLLLAKAKEALLKIRDYSKTRSKSAIIVGLPLEFNNKIYNCGAIIHKGKILSVTPKTYLPNYNEYYEARWFTSGEEIDTFIPLNTTSIKSYVTDDFSNVIEDKDYSESGNSDAAYFGVKRITQVNGLKIGVEICEDLWVPAPPSTRLALAGADVIVNLSASNETIGKHRYREQLIQQQSANLRAVYVYASAGDGESSTDLAFPGYVAIAENGRMLAKSEPFTPGGLCVRADIDIERIRHDRRLSNTFCAPAYMEIEQIKTINQPDSDDSPVGIDISDNQVILEGMIIDRQPFVPSDPNHRNENCTEIINIQCHGLRQRLSAIYCEKLVIGISGGLDSTLALLVACRTFDLMGIPRNGIYGITMPGLATTSRTRSNAHKLMDLLGVTSIEIPIGDAVAQHFKDINQNPENHDAAFENSQARERTQILMDYANKIGGIVLGTGDLSELALGWCTYNGDQMSMYGINASVPKTLVKHLVEWFAERADNREEAAVLRDIIDTPISPELIPSDESADRIAQKTEDLVGPYELHDFFLYHTLRNAFNPQKIFFMAKDAFAGKYDEVTILKWLRNFYSRFFSQQFKRSCMPDGPKVGSVCLSPRGDWRMPSDASRRMWLSQIDELEKR